MFNYIYSYIAQIFKLYNVIYSIFNNLFLFHPQNHWYWFMYLLIKLKLLTIIFKYFDSTIQNSCFIFHLKNIKNGNSQQLLVPFSWYHLMSFGSNTTLSRFFVTKKVKDQLCHLTKVFVFLVFAGMPIVILLITPTILYEDQTEQNWYNFISLFLQAPAWASSY